LTYPGSLHISPTAELKSGSAGILARPARSAAGGSHLIAGKLVMSEKEFNLKTNGSVLPEANPRVSASRPTEFQKHRRYEVELSDGRIITLVISTAADRSAITKFPRVADLLRRANRWGTIVIEGSRSSPILWAMIRLPEIAVWPSSGSLEPGIGAAVQVPLEKYVRGL
jgi:hypothetical protein